jgi:hypothetical protein
MSQREIVATVTLLILVALVALVAQTVRRRIAKQSALGELSSDRLLTGELIGAASGQYVSTVFAHNPLERLMSHGLMHRGRVDLSILADGIKVLRLGERSFSIPKDAITRVFRSNATIDRVVEQDGMVSIAWMLGSTEVESNFRLNSDDDSKILFAQFLQLRSKGAVS